MFFQIHNDVIIVNCTVSDLSQNKEFKGELIHGDSKDRIQILYSTIRADNLIKINELFSKNVINISDLCDITCPNNDDSKGNSIGEFKHSVFYRKSIGVFVRLVLSIVIPCVVVYLAVIDLIVICSKRPTPPNNMETSQINFAQKQ